MDTVTAADEDGISMPAAEPLAEDSIASRKRRRSAAAGTSGAATNACPLCSKILPSNEAAAMEHVDRCLAKAAQTDTGSQLSGSGDGEAPVRRRTRPTSRGGGRESKARAAASAAAVPLPDALRDHGLSGPLNPVQQVAMMLGTVGVPGSALLGHSVMAPAPEGDEEAAPSHGTLPWLGYEALAPVARDQASCVVVVAVVKSVRDAPALLTGAKFSVTMDDVCSALLRQTAQVRLASLLHVRYLPRAAGADTRDAALLPAGDASIVPGINGDPDVLAALPQELTLHSWAHGGLLHAHSNCTTSGDTSSTGAQPLRVLATLNVGEYTQLWQRLLSNWGRNLHCNCTAPPQAAASAAAAPRRPTASSSRALQHPLHAHCGRRMSGDVALFTWFALDTLLHELGPRAFPALKRAASSDAAASDASSDDLSPLAVTLLASWQQHAAYRHLIGTVPRYAQYFDLEPPKTSSSSSGRADGKVVISEGEVTTAVGKWIAAAVAAWLKPA